MTKNWVTFMDNQGCRVSGPVEDISLILESVEIDGKRFTGIKFGNNAISWVDASFDETLVEIFHSDIASVKLLKTGGKADFEVPSIPETKDEAPGFGFQK